MQQNNKTQVSPFQKYRFTPDDLEELGPLGAGNYGTVLKMNHKATGTEMAVKVRCGEDEREMERRRGGERERVCVCLRRCFSLLLQKIPVPELRVNQKDNIVELAVVMGTGTCPDIVEYYGCLIREVYGVQ